MMRKTIIIFCFFLFSFLFFTSPASSQYFLWNQPYGYPFNIFGKSPAWDLLLSNYPQRAMQQVSSSIWPVYTPPFLILQSQAQIPPLPWSWPPANPFPGITQIPLNNWPQLNYFPAAGYLQTYNWPVYTPLPGPVLPMQITLIHTGDIHGHLIPRAHIRSDGNGLMRGGLARMFTRISEIRLRHPSSLLIVCGDTIQGSAEALYTQGKAIVDVLKQFKIDAFAPGNWDYLYGTDRFIELFAYPDPIAPWNALASNLYYDQDTYAGATGQRVLPPYKIKYVNGIKVGILGFTTHFMPGVLPETIGRGFRFTQGDAELAEFIPLLREIEKVDLLVMISELGLARNIRLAETHPGIDVILSSDLHEETREPVVTSTGTIIVEEGTDGTIVGELTLDMDRGRIVNFQFKQHVIDSTIPENWLIAARIAQIRAPFVSGPGFRQHINPINGISLKVPIDTVIGQTAIGLHRSNFSHEPIPAVVEGSSHDFITDAFRTIAQGDVGNIQGFRYGTHVPPGPIRLEDIYHFLPFGPLIAKGQVTGLQLKLLIENSTDSTLNPDVTLQGGGWLLAWSGLTYDLDPYSPVGQRAQNIMVMRWLTNTWEPLNPSLIYTFASTHFPVEPNLINKMPANNIQIVTGPDGIPLDATEVVMEYLKIDIANPVLNRIRLLKPLPPYRYNNPEVQPLWGAQP